MLSVSSQKLHVVDLAAYKNQEMIEVTRALLHLAEKGEARGLSFVVKLGRGDHRAGCVGDYRRNPEEAMSAVFRMERELMRNETPFDQTDFQESIL